MKLREIEIIGFKSFVDRVNLQLLPGITVLVGPNGCGKSNIVDAIRWAMGEQSAKHLRGKSMEDVIFDGSETKKPLGMAEVSLIFENNNGSAPAEFSSYSEIMVTRRLFRSGESEYYINKVPCRLKDITELFMDTGVGTRSYSIIEQGKVEMLINSKPMDRRVLLEEAAGVLKYKSRKREALSKMDSTRQNLLRVNDILVELTTQMSALKRQAGRLKGYQRLKERIRETDLILSSRKYREMRIQEEETNKALTALQDEEIKLDTEVKKAESILEIKRLEQYEREQSLGTLQKELFDNTSHMQKCLSTIEFSQKELSEIKKRNETAGKELEELSLQMDKERGEVEELEKREGEYQELLSREEENIRGRESALSQLKEEYHEKLRTIENEKSALVDLLTEIAHGKNSMIHYEKNLEDLKRRSEKTNNEKSEVTTRYAEIKKRIDALTEECSRVKEAKGDLEVRRNKKEEEYRHREKTVEEKEKTCKETQEVLEKNRIQLHSFEELERKYEGYTSGVRSLMTRNDGENNPGNGHYRLLADCIRIEPGYEIALEAVLGERLQSIIMKDWNEVWESIDYLKNNSGGRGTFIPLQARKDEITRDAPVPPAPDAQPLLNLVEGEGETSPVVQRLLKGVWVVKDLKETVELRSDDNYQLFVTNEGTVLYPSGMVTGGNKESLDSGILKRKRRIRELTRSIHHLEKDYGEQVKAYQETCGHLAEAKKDLAALQEEIQELALSVIHKERDGIQAEEGLRETEQRLKLLHLEEEEIESLIQETKNEYTNVQGVKEEKEKTKCEKESALHDLQDSLQGMEEAMHKEEGEITLLKINQASLREKREHCLSLLLSKKDQLDNLLARIESIQKKVRDEEERGKALEAALNEAQDALDDLIQSEQILKKKVDEEKELAQQGLEHIHQMEEKLKGLRKMFMDVQPRLNELNLKLTEYHLNMHHLKNDIQEKYHSDLEPLWEEFSSKREEADTELAGILQRLKAKLENFGEVNLMAQQELDELQKRHAFLSQQHEDLEQTMESLKKVINKINATIRDKFLDTFNAVNEKFKEIFPKLFRGGQAELILSEESDILETGIEIIAQPPGKRLQNMDLLSGGEKAMTAVALLLALFMVKPSPFCLLDEVDSPLDDMNTFRFIEQLKEMSGNDSKFILITHNKKTMEGANTLYGITMEEKGITKVVSVKLN